MRPPRFRMLASAIGAALMAMALIAPTAMAATPAPGYERFAGCPSPEENPTVFACLYSVVKSGHFQMGSKDVPITNPITLSGGMNGEGKAFANAKGGLVPVKQKVPGGVIGLTGLTWLAELFGSEALTLYAVTELVGQPTVGLQELSLPIRVHLINPVLGNNCYVGSPASPIKLNMTTGTTAPPPPNKPITGKEFGYVFDEVARTLTADGTLVDNSFAAPGANGCTLTLFGFIPISINGLVNSQSGLPSAAGTNETVQNAHVELAEVGVVYP